MNGILDYIKLHLSFDGAGREVEELDVLQVKEDVYEIAETPVFTEKVTFGDIIRVRSEKDVFIYMETIEKSKFTRYNWLLSKQVIHSLELKILKNKIKEWQGKAEQVFGGIFIVNLPSDSEIDINSEVQKVIKMVQK